jgi:hypothetical protein
MLSDRYSRSGPLLWLPYREERRCRRGRLIWRSSLNASAAKIAADTLPWSSQRTTTRAPFCTPTTPSWNTTLSPSARISGSTPRCVSSLDRIDIRRSHCNPSARDRHLDFGQSATFGERGPSGSGNCSRRYGEKKRKAREEAPGKNADTPERRAQNSTWGQRQICR